MRKKRGKNDLFEDQASNSGSWILGNEEESNREFKVRIVERLTYLERKLNGNEGDALSEEVEPLVEEEESSRAPAL